MPVATLAKDVIAEAKGCRLTIAVAESCTGGALAVALSKAPGAGEHFHGGVVTYTKDAKNAVLSVPMQVLKEKTAVCAEVAEAMAAGALELFPADIAVAITGVAGPDPDEDGNPVGLVYVASAKRGAPAQLAVELRLKEAGREAIIEQAMREALLMLSRTCRLESSGSHPVEATA